MKQGTDSGHFGWIQSNIVSLVFNREMYGLEISKRLESRGLEVGANQLYPALKRLAEIGAIEARRDERTRPARIYYKATPNGRLMLTKGALDLINLFRDIIGEKLAFLASDTNRMLDLPHDAIVMDFSKDHFEDFYKILVPPLSPLGRYFITCNEYETPIMLRERINYLGFQDVMKVFASWGSGKLQIPDGSVDAVICLFTMRGETGKWIAAESSRLLKHGGRLALMDWILAKNDPRRGFIADLFPDRGGIDPDDCKAFLESKGFILELRAEENGILKAIFKR
jgi:DNA-binding PadR family transcriptional regulator